MLSQGKTMKLDEVVNLVLKQMGLDKNTKSVKFHRYGREWWEE